MRPVIYNRRRVVSYLSYQVVSRNGDTKIQTNVDYRGEPSREDLDNYENEAGRTSTPPNEERSILVNSLDDLRKIAVRLQKPTLHYVHESIVTNASDSALPEIFYVVDGETNYVFRLRTARVATRKQGIPEIMPETIPIPAPSEVKAIPLTGISSESFVNLGRLPTRDLLKNITFLRVLAVSGAILVSVLLLIYSFMFLFTFYRFGNTTSYFPWRWMATLTSERTGSILNLFYIGVGISDAAIPVLSVALAFFLFPAFRKSLRTSRLQVC